MTPVVFHSCDATLLAQFRESRIDPREHRGLSELGKDALSLGQMLKGEGTLFLDLVKQPKNHFRVANMVPIRIETRILQYARH